MDEDTIMNFLKGGEYSDMRQFARTFAEAVYAFENEGFSRDEAIDINIEITKWIMFTMRGDQ